MRCLIGLIFLLTTALGFAQECPSTLSLYYSPSCPFSIRVLDYLKSVGKTVPLKDVKNDPQAKTELKEYGGKLQVPCLFIDNEPLYESNEIIQWLSNHQQCLRAG